MRCWCAPVTWTYLCPLLAT